jgi:arginase family enzyme
MLNAEFFKPVATDAIDISSTVVADSLASVTAVYSLQNGFPDTDQAKVALIGVPEYRGSHLNRQSSEGSDAVRDKLYKLKKHEKSSRIIDLGDLVPGNTLEDTHYALTEIIEELLKRGVIPVILGGSQELTVAQFNAYHQFKKLLNVAGIDSRFDLGMPDESFNNTSWLGKLILQQPNYLFNFSNIGYQTYFVGSAAVELMSKLYFDAYRVGEVRTDISEIEPVIRTADMMTFDLSSIRQSDAPGTSNPSPNGLTGEEACQAMMYAGLNDQLTSLGIYELNTSTDRNNQTAHLVAQMIWYFIEGVNNRKNDFPMADRQGFTTYRVTVEKSDDELIFLKHLVSGRWWMEMPASLTGFKKHLARYQYLPCSYRDYQQACKNEMPDRYWQVLQKL